MEALRTEAEEARGARKETEAKTEAARAEAREAAARAEVGTRRPKGELACMSRGECAGSVGDCSGVARVFACPGVNELSGSVVGFVDAGVNSQAWWVNVRARRVNSVTGGGRRKLRIGS
eukprot:9148113-Pyramimonas_sp.AAC.1